MDLGIAEVDQVLFQLVLVRIRVSVQPKQVDLDMCSVAIGELAVVTQCQAWTVSVLIRVQQDVRSIVLVVAESY